MGQTQSSSVGSERFTYGVIPSTLLSLILFSQYPAMASNSYLLRKNDEFGGGFLAPDLSHTPKAMARGF